MADRNLNFTPTETRVVPDADTGLDGIISGVAEIGQKIADQSAQSKLLLATTKAHAAYKSLDADFRTQYAGDPSSKEGLQKLTEDRAAVAEGLGADVPLLYQRQFTEKTAELASASDISNDLWRTAQNKSNTVSNVNTSISNYTAMANKDGRAFGSSNATDGSEVMNYLGARKQLENFGGANLGADKTGALLKDFNKDYVKSFVAGIAETSPSKAYDFLHQDSIKDNFTTEERGEMIDLINRTKHQQKLAADVQVTANSAQLVDIVNDPKTTYYEKRATIDQLDMQGAVTPTAAAKARRVIRSSADVESQTSTPVMSDIIAQTYDLNAIAGTNQGDYLRGVRHINDQILDKQQSGELAPADATKLTRQVRELSAKRLSDATQSVGYEFADANDMFEAQLPPESRAKATRDLFYASDGKNFNPAQYKAAAKTIIDNTNNANRQAALKTVAATAKADSEFLKVIKASPADITSTAQKYHISEQEVIRRLREHHTSPKTSVTRASSDETFSDTPSAPVSLRGGANPSGDDEAVDEGAE